MPGNLQVRPEGILLGVSKYHFGYKILQQIEK
jgi:hypothetical protein